MHSGKRLIEGVEPDSDPRTSCFFLHPPQLIAMLIDGVLDLLSIQSVRDLVARADVSLTFPRAVARWQR